MVHSCDCNYKVNIILSIINLRHIRCIDEVNEYVVVWFDVDKYKVLIHYMNNKKK